MTRFSLTLAAAAFVCSAQDHIGPSLVISDPQTNLHAARKCAPILNAMPRAIPLQFRTLESRKCHHLFGETYQ